jgi:lipopolysaccharide export system protein LptC
MQLPRDRYSRRVAIAKIALPLLAVALLASLFIYSKTNPVRDGLIFADSELKRIASEAQITNPRFSGVTTAGDAFSVSATIAIPDAPKPGRIDLTDPSASISFASGVDLESSAKTGSLDIKTSIARLAGEVFLQTSNGYRAETSEIMVNLRSGNVESPDGVRASGPIGEIEAGAMQLVQDLDKNPGGGQSVLIFKNGVKVVYTPAAAQEKGGNP